MADIFLSHSSADNKAADTVKAWLARDRPSWSVFLDKHPNDGILAGQGWQNRLRAELTSCRLVLAIITPDWLASPWCFTEAVTADFRGKDLLPVLPKALPDEAFKAAPPILNTNQRRIIDLATEVGWPDILRALDRSGLDPDQWFAIADNVGPYPGFVAFEERDAGVFFGRDGEITDYLAALNKLRAPGRAQALVISGGSGTGKSSLLKAGLIPRLRRRQDWCIIPPFDPSREPLHAFLASLRETSIAAGIDLDLPVGADSTAETLFAAIDEAMRRLEERTKAWLLLPMDQAEALVASGATEQGEEGRRLLDLVGQLLATRRRGLVAIFTIRTEFLPRLETAISGGVRLEQKPLGGIRALADVIELPAERFGIELEPGLSSRMVEDTRGAEALPLLAYTLKELNERFGDDKKLTMEEYERLGGVEGAIRTKLAEALSDPPPSATEMAALRRTFVRYLIRVDEQAVEGARYLRRAVKKTRLPAAAERLRDRLIEARLLVEGQDSTVAVAHERLIGNWPEAPIADWLAADAADRRLVDALRSRLDEHRRDGPLLGGRPLLDAEDLLGRDTLLDQEEPELAAFIRESRAAERKRLTREKWQLRGAITAAAVFLIVAAGAVWFFLDARDKTRIAEKNLATANRAVASAIWNDLPEWTDYGQPLPVRSLNALWQLATGRLSLAMPFLAELTFAPDRAVRFGTNVNVIMNAIGGPSALSPGQAEVALVAVLDAIATTDSYRTLVEAVEALAPKLVAEQASTALVSVLDAISNTTDPYELEALAQAVEALGPSPEQAWTALVPVLVAITNTFDQSGHSALAPAVEALAPKLGAEQAGAALVPILDAITYTTEPIQLQALALAVEALGPSPEQALTALVPVLDAISNGTTTGSQTSVLAHAVEALAPKLGAEQAWTALVSVLGGITNTNDPYYLEALVPAVEALAPKLVAEQASTALVQVLDAISNTTNSYELRALARIVEALGPSPEQAWTVLVPVLDAISNVDGSGSETGALVEVIESFAPKLVAEQASMALVSVLDAITNVPEVYYEEHLDYLADAVEVLAPKLGAEQAWTALVPVFHAITNTTDRWQLQALAHAVETLAPKLGAEQARAALATVLDAITNPTGPDMSGLARVVAALGPSPEQAWMALVPILDAITGLDYNFPEHLAHAVEALAPKLEAEQALTALVQVLDAITNTTDVNHQYHLAPAVEALAPKLEAEQALTALVPVLDAITNVTELHYQEHLVVFLAPAVEVLAPKLEADQASTALVAVLDVITYTTDPDQLQALARVVAALGPSPEQPLTALIPALDAITNVTEPYHRQLLAQVIESFAPKLGTEQTRAALAQVLDAITNSTEPYQLVALARAVQALAPKLEGLANPAKSDGLRSALAWAPSSDSAAALAAAYGALLPREPNQAFVTAVVTPLGFPLVAGPATDVLIEALRETGGPGKEAGLDATLAWLRKAYPDIDLDAVPACPPPPAGWEGLQCPAV